jgi:glycosyltransferase involved in cell wall biosynthesis
MERKNIIFVLNEYNGFGGAQRVAAILADEFLQDKHNVAILSINELKNEPSYFSDHIPVKVVHPDGYRPPAPIGLFSSLKSLKFKKALNEIKRRQVFSKKVTEVSDFIDSYGGEDVYIIVVQVYGMEWLQPLLYKPNVKFIGQSHESIMASKGSLRYDRILKFYRQVSKFLLLTEKDSDYFKSIGFTNVDVMKNPTTFREFTDANQLYANKTVVSTGRLVDGKGFDILIESFAKVAVDIPDWKLHIYGDGPLKKSLKNLINILGMKDRIILKGQTDDVKSALKNSSFFVLASKAEGLPMSLIEAQSCGLPCISTDCAPGIREIINEYNDGLVCPVDDIAVLSRHIKNLATNETSFISYSKNAFENSLRFERSTIKKQWYDLFSEIGGNRDGK